MSPLTPEQQEELAKVFAANRATQDALNRRRRMETGELEIELVRGSVDPQVHEPAYQVELNRFKDPLNEAGISYKQSAIAFDSIDAHGYPIGQFALEFLKDYAPVISAVLAAWITAKYGRRVRVKFKDIEVEARSVEEVERLVDKLLIVADQERGPKNEEVE